MEYTIRVGGEAGQGLLSIGSVLTKILSRYGFHVFTHQDYMSRIRGGHDFYQIRFSDSPVAASRDQVDVLLALDMDTIEFHRHDLHAGGRIVYDAASLGTKFSGHEFLDIPLARITEEKGADQIMVNSVAVGTILGLFGLDVDQFAVIIGSTMSDKGEGIVATNIAVAQAGMDFVEQTYPDIDSLKVFKPKTKGQASPSTKSGKVTKTQPFGNPSEPLNPLAMAIALDCSFVARAFAGASGLPFLQEIMKEAIHHNGFALVDILQNCVSFNKENTFHWYKDRVYRLEEGYDPVDRVEAFRRSLEWGDKIPTGIFYRNERETCEQRLPPIREIPLARKPVFPSGARQEVNNFY